MQITEIRIYDDRLSDIIVRHHDDGIVSVTDETNEVNDHPCVFFTEETALQLVEAIRKIKETQQ